MSFMRRRLGIAFIVAVLILSAGAATASPHHPEAASGEMTLSNNGAVDISYTPGDIGVGQVCSWVATVSPWYSGPFDYDWSERVGLAQAFDANETWGGYSSSSGWYSLTVKVTGPYGFVGSATVTGRVESPPYLSPDPNCTY